MLMLVGCLDETDHRMVNVELLIRLPPIARIPVVNLTLSMSCVVYYSRRNYLILFLLTYRRSARGGGR